MTRGMPAPANLFSATHAARALWLCALTLASGCGAAPAASAERDVSSTRASDVRGTVWVVAPHPDDEVLMASEALSVAVASGAPYQIAIVTNGDFTCARNGWVRQHESLAALATLGVTEDHVHFLGYPDGWLSELSDVPLAPIPRAEADGDCSMGSTTYGTRGAERSDVHSALTGAPAPLTATALVDDLLALFTASPPSEIHLPHPIDDHPDHAMTYAYVRRALERASLARLPLLLRHVVHAGSCWPASDEAGGCLAPGPELDATALPALPPPLSGYRPDQVIAADPARRRAAIERYTTQLGGPADSSWLASFARSTEAAWSERLARGVEGPLLPRGAFARSSHANSDAFRDTLELGAEASHSSRVDASRTLEITRIGSRLLLAVHADGLERVSRSLEIASHEGAMRLRLYAFPDGPTGAWMIELHGDAGYVMGVLDARSGAPLPE